MRIAMVGDVMLGRLVNRILREKGPVYAWGDTLPVFQRADLRVCNLECVLSGRGRPWSQPPKMFYFRSDASHVAALEAAGIDAVSLANNHVLDYEYDAMYEMLSILDAHGIAHSGAGDSLEQASLPGIVEKDGERFGIIAFTDNEPGWAAAGAHPGVRYVNVDLENEQALELLGSVTVASRQLNMLAVSAHWGPNWGYEPPAAHIPFAHALIDAGADIVFGHSGHVFRGIEFYAGKPIIYCAGNFIDDYAVDEIERNDESFIFLLEVEDSEVIRMKLVPTVIGNMQARLAPAGHAKSIASKMKQLCEELGTRSVWRGSEGVLEIFPD